jgi:hypothetical protein
MGGVNKAKRLRKLHTFPMSLGQGVEVGSWKMGDTNRAGKSKTGKFLIVYAY